jgi:hypothetical protein
MVDPATSKKLIAIVLFGLSVVLVGASFNISNNNWQNIVVVLAGVSLTFAIALAIIDSITDNIFEKQWSVVRILSYEEIATHLCDMLWFLDYKMKILRYAEGIGQPLNDIIEGRVIPYTGFAETTNRAIPELLRNLQSIDISKSYDPSDEIVKYYESIEPERDRIHNLMYNVIQSSRNQRVI